MLKITSKCAFIFLRKKNLITERTLQSAVGANGVSMGDGTLLSERNWYILIQNWTASSRLLLSTARIKKG